MTVRIWGSEQLVNTQTGGTQSRPSVATLANGDLIVVWREEAGMPSYDIRGRLFGANGVAKSGELVLTNSAAQDNSPVVAALAGGGFQLAYEKDGTIDLLRFTASGAPDGAPSGFFYNPGVSDLSVASFGSGKGFVVGYSFDFEGSRDTGVSLYDANGFAVDGFAASGPAANAQSSSDVAAMSGGRFVSAWTDNDNQIKAQIFSAMGGIGGNITIRDAGANIARYPEIAGLESGGFAVMWTEISPAGADVFAAVYDSAGTAIVPRMLANSRSAGDQQYGDLVALPGGGFVAVWYDASTFAVRGQEFDNIGGRVGAEFQVNSHLAQVAIDRGLTAALMADGRIAVTWNTDMGGLGDDGYGIHMQIVDPRDGNVAGTAGADTLYGSDYVDQILGGAGNDTVFAGAGADIVFGGQGEDTLNGGNGDDIVYGEDGNDTILGDAGNDVLWGGIGNDTMRGSYGDDTLNGGKGDDMMFGGVGSDTFTGGLGHDTLQGGLGYADTFRYQAAADSTIASNDFITDFEHGSDKIDLSFIRVNGGTNVSISSSGGVTYVNVDLNADGSNDMHIQALGTNVLDITDIILPTVNAGGAMVTQSPHVEGGGTFLSHYLLV